AAQGRKGGQALDGSSDRVDPEIKGHVKARSEKSRRERSFGQGAEPEMQPMTRDELVLLLSGWQRERRLVQWKFIFRGLLGAGVGRIEEVSDGVVRIDARSIRSRGDLDGCRLEIAQP